MVINTTKPISTISDFLASSDTLSQICNHIKKINGLQIKLGEFLGKPPAEHVAVADYRQNTLVLHTDSAAWAAKLRYRTPEILAAFKGDLPGIRTVRIKVVPTAMLMRIPRRALKVSAGTAEGIRQAADQIADPALRSTLHSIARNLGSE